MIRFPREQSSLFGEILDWMLMPLLLLWPMSVVLTWAVAQGIANRPYDRALAQTTQEIARRVVAADEQRDAVGTLVTLRHLVDELAREEDGDRLHVQILGRRGEYVAGERNLPVPDIDTLRGDVAPRRVGEVQFRDERFLDDEVRIAHLWLEPPAGDEAPRALVQVAQTLGQRKQLAGEIIKGVIFPQFVILPLAVLLVWFALSRGLRPLEELQSRIRRRDSLDLSPLEDRDVPEEMSPFVRSINDLLARLNVSLGAQKHFLTDAAHQLKTPLAGLRTQAELAQRELDAGDIPAARRSMRQIARSSQRSAHLVNQLLALARAEDMGLRQRMQPVNLLRLAEETVRDFHARAQDKAIDMGVEGAEPDSTAPTVWTSGHAVLVRELVRNLVDNALLYTPTGGRVTVRLLDDPFGKVAVLQVEDDGPGIAPSERELVFQPFFRGEQAQAEPVEGSGLGLAIVREIAQAHGAEVLIDDAHPRAAGRLPGTRVSVRFAAAQAPAD
jgi:two-component system, OmpR family, sensor histidine kinase TctE